MPTELTPALGLSGGFEIEGVPVTITGWSIRWARLSAGSIRGYGRLHGTMSREATAGSAFERVGRAVFGTLPPVRVRLDCSEGEPYGAGPMDLSDGEAWADAAGDLRFAADFNTSGPFEYAPAVAGDARPEPGSAAGRPGSDLGTRLEDTDDDAR
jgi:hypothetical protein